MAPPAPAPVTALAAAPAAESVVPKLTSFSLDRDERVRFSVNLELKLDEPELDKAFVLDKVPLKGKWTLEVERKGDQVTFEALHGTLAVGDLGDNAEVTLELDWHDGLVYRKLAHENWSCVTVPSMNPNTKTAYGGYRLTVWPSTLATATRESNGAFNAATQRKYRLTFELRQAGSSPRFGAKEVAERLPDFGTKAVVNDVRLFFPKTVGRPAAELWTSQDLLTRCSPYFVAVFNSGLTECIPIEPKRSRDSQNDGTLSSSPASPGHPTLGTFEDSDDETDELAVKQAKLHLHDPVKDGAFPYKQVVVTQTAYSTYRAVLLWMQTGFIAFSPVTSSFATAESRAGALEATGKENPSLPLPVSPKSVYRLAHVLELPALESLSMKYLRDECLTLETAPVELFSDVARFHKPWRDVILEWVLEHWDEVEASEAWEQTMHRVEDGVVEETAGILVELLRRVSKQKGQKS